MPSSPREAKRHPSWLQPPAATEQSHWAEPAAGAGSVPHAASFAPLTTLAVGFPRWGGGPGNRTGWSLAWSPLEIPRPLKRRFVAIRIPHHQVPPPLACELPAEPPPLLPLLHPQECPAPRRRNHLAVALVLVKPDGAEPTQLAGRHLHVPHPSAVLECALRIFQEGTSRLSVRGTNSFLIQPPRVHRLAPEHQPTRKQARNSKARPELSACAPFATSCPSAL